MKIPRSLIPLLLGGSAALAAPPVPVTVHADRLVGDIRHGGLSKPAEPAAYVHYPQVGRTRVNLVVRGEDLLESAGRQIRLARMLGRSMPPQFLHHVLIRRPGGEKLSKSSGDTGIRELRAKGLPPSEVIGRAAFLSGLSAEERGLDPGELPAIIAAALEA